MSEVGQPIRGNAEPNSLQSLAIQHFSVQLPERRRPPFEGPMRELGSRRPEPPPVLHLLEQMGVRPLCTRFGLGIPGLYPSLSSQHSARLTPITSPKRVAEEKGKVAHWRLGISFLGVVDALKM